MTKARTPQSRPEGEPFWLTIELILAIHEEQLFEHGGSSGVRDRGLLESALARPLNVFHFENAQIQYLAAIYASGIMRNHPFVDGNKRTGFMAMYTFLGANGYQLKATEPEAVAATMELAAGELSDDQFAAWVADHSEMITSPVPPSES